MVTLHIPKKHIRPRLKVEIKKSKKEILKYITKKLNTEIEKVKENGKTIYLNTSLDEDKLSRKELKKFGSELLRKFEKNCSVTLLRNKKSNKNKKKTLSDESTEGTIGAVLELDGESGPDDANDLPDSDSESNSKPKYEIKSSVKFNLYYENLEENTVETVTELIKEKIPDENACSESKVIEGGYSIKLRLYYKDIDEIVTNISNLLKEKGYCLRASTE
ncbi:hypothetical protein COEREDRAFT_87536 [Coemansia reversa NRRL 1564]|uniref:Uncharacterized protein n=1 Tax=Coemansia reversa (strain ATCC 12441 / NRRL 1564) TaxID=763665 RepID=A0A2G5B9T9_COERN|nr:hypothetical protein COEREDRAFT_87536 [Coemansia reversa NRRL 1564]|eukprot:PIA15786.1 hypothetical protein COEREDRAFT_87536 [Coemansia reversa NRRL 1564]